MALGESRFEWPDLELETLYQQTLETLSTDND